MVQVLTSLLLLYLLPSSPLGAGVLVSFLRASAEHELPWEDPGQEEAEGLGWGRLTCCSPQVKDCTDHVVLPMDGATLAEVMRQRGINMRYLGKVLDLVLRSPARDQLDHIYVSGP